MNTNLKAKEYRQKLADAFAEALEKDALEWKKGWELAYGFPENAQTGKEYKGINRLYLFLMAQEKGYADPRWATFKQIQTNGWSLQKGAKGEKVEYWVPYDTTLKKYISWDEYNYRRLASQKTEAEIQFFPQYYTVFNGQFIDGLEPMTKKEATQIPALDELVGRASTSMGVGISNDGGNNAYYQPSEDKIHLPAPEAFISAYEYNATALHELSHATGAPNRLNRNIENAFGSKSYAYEELVAEISAAFMGRILPLEQSLHHIDNHVAYVQAWIQKIREQPDVLVRAVRDAEQAADYLEYHAGLIPLAEAEKNTRSSLNIKNEVDRDEAVENQSLQKEGPKVNTEDQRDYLKEQEEKRYLADEHILSLYGDRPSLSQVSALMAVRPLDSVNEFKNWLGSPDGREAYRLTEHMKEYGYQFASVDQNSALDPVFLWKNEETGKTVPLTGFDEARYFLEEQMTKALILRASKEIVKEQGMGLEMGLPTAVDAYFLSDWGENTLPAFENWLQTEEGQQILLLSKQMNDAGFQFQDFNWNFTKMQWKDADGNITEFEDWRKISEYLGHWPELRNPEITVEEEAASLGRLEFFTMDEEHQPTYYASPENALKGFLEEDNQGSVCTLGFHFPEIESKRFALFTSTQKEISAVDNLDVLTEQHPDVAKMAKQIEQHMADTMKAREQRDTFEYMINEHLIARTGDRPSLNIVQGMESIYEKSAMLDTEQFSTHSLKNWLENENGGQRAYRLLDWMETSQFDYDVERSRDGEKLCWSHTILKNDMEFSSLDDVETYLAGIEDQGIEELLEKHTPESAESTQPDAASNDEAHMRRIYDIITINDQYRFNALETELEARESSGQEYAVNQNFRDYATDELREAVGLLKDGSVLQERVNTIDKPPTKPRYATSQDSLDRMSRSGVPQDFSERLFLGVDFSNKNLQGYSFIGSQFEHCKFQNTNLTGSNFDNAIIRDCDFIKADLTDASFQKAELLGNRFKESSLVQIRFAEASIRKSVFQDGTILENVNFENCRISDVNFADVVNRGGHYNGNTAQIIMLGATSEENLRYQQTVKGVLSKGLEEKTVSGDVSISPELREKLKSMQEAGMTFKIGCKGTVKIPENADKWLSHAEIDAVSNYIKSVAGKEKNQHRAVGCDCEP